MKSLKGFTLIELTIVILLLTVLAAVAIPRFLDIRTESHIATLKALSGALKSAADKVYGKSSIQAIHKEANSIVDIDSDNVGDITTEFGYPSDDRNTGITLAMDENFADSWAWSTRNGPRRVVITSGELSLSGPGKKVNNVPITTGNCYLTYIAPTSFGQAPSIVLTTSGC